MDIIHIAITKILNVNNLRGFMVTFGEINDLGFK